MPRVSYEPSVLDAVIRSAASVREAGKPWKDAFAAAKKAGFKGSESSLQKLVRAQMPGGKPNQAPKLSTGEPAGYKNAAKASEKLSAGSNAFQKTLSLEVPASVASASVLESTPHTTDTLESIQNRLPVLRDGTFYPRPISLFDGAFHSPNDGEIVAWSRILEKEEALCVKNSNSCFPRGADILVDSTLNPPGSFLTVIHVDAEKSDAYAIGEHLPVLRRGDGTAFVAVREVGPAVSLLLSNSPHAKAVSA